ncbi:CGNR zinc finger domain-containing protein [uncultured Amnibacterium sp.]|uniref:CGNR zinc finger domain-containing protein n=1 Tax=uncultured Amnibacterium sp. TaxID=1631851 RepID=UPI0035CBF2E5
MLFTHDVELSLAAATTLVNTLPDASHSGEDELRTMTQLDAWFDGEGFTGDRLHTTVELESLRALRLRLRALWETEREIEVVSAVNGMLAEGGALPRLVDHDGFGWHIHANAPDAPLADRVMVEIAMAWVDVLRQGERARMKRCAADDCEAVLVDFSRNRSKRFCDVGNCGNRMHVRAFRARSAAS